MDDFKNKLNDSLLLDDKHGLDVTLPTPLPFEIPNKFINIPNTVIKNVNSYLSVVITMGTGRDIEVENILENIKVILKDGGINYHDHYWKQHCAASFRELIVFLEPGTYRSAFLSIPQEGIDQRVEYIFGFLDKATTYLSDVVHFRESAKLGNYDKMYPNQGYGEMNKIEFLSKEHIYLEKIFIDVVYALNQLFCDYCVGSKK